MCAVCVEECEAVTNSEGAFNDVNHMLLGVNVYIQLDFGNVRGDLCIEEGAGVTLFTLKRSNHITALSRY